MDGDAVSGPSGIENADAECLELPAFRSRNSIPSRFPESSVRESNSRSPRESPPCAQIQRPGIQLQHQFKTNKYPTDKEKQHEIYIWKTRLAHKNPRPGKLLSSHKRPGRIFFLLHDFVKYKGRPCIANGLYRTAKPPLSDDKPSGRMPGMGRSFSAFIQPGI